MKNVKWTDNVCTVGGTCVHGNFTGKDLDLLLSMCKGASFTPTFYSENLPARSYNNTGTLWMTKQWNGWLYDQECGYYITFMESDGTKLLNYLKERFPMIRGENCR